MTRDQVVTEARAWLGTRYHHGQHAKGIGCDCYGLALGVGLVLAMASAQAAVNDPQCQGYGPQPDGTNLLAVCAKYLRPIAIDEAGLGDLYLMRWENEPHHFAIVSRLDPIHVIHAFASAPRKVCETPIRGEWKHGVPWQSLIVSAWRYRELID